MQYEVEEPTWECPRCSKSYRLGDATVPGAAHCGACEDDDHAEDLAELERTTRPD